MTRRIARRLLVGALLLGVLPGAASASDGTMETTLIETDPGTDGFAAGGGKSELLVAEPATSFNLSAHTREGDGFGHVGMMIQASPENVHVLIDVDCINVNELTRSAVLTGTVTYVSPSPNPLNIDVGDRRDTYVEDDGPPSAGPVDGFLSLPGSVGSLASCRSGSLTTLPELNNVTQGNITIKSG